MDTNDLACVEWAVNNINTVTSAENRLVEAGLMLLDDDWQEITFGTADVVSMVPRANGDTLVVADYKSGNYKDYKPQLHVYARMAMQRYGVNRCECRILFGMDRRYEMFVVNYNETDYIIDIINKINAGQLGEEKANEFCCYCMYQSTCPQTQAIVTAVAKADGYDITGLVDWSIDNATPEKLSQMYTAATWLEKFAERIKEGVKQKIKDGTEVPGYRFVSITRRSITDIPAAFQASGLTQEEFLDACTVSAAKLEKKMGKTNFGANMASLVHESISEQLKRTSYEKSS
ncbi:MAG: DUF2800 domain-containing protein [Oscillospiraceae bacterium]|nr:DUF2800 domain-containing protein [Oscillospiraceae bacterium]